MSTPIRVELTLDIDKHLYEVVGMDRDGEYQTGPTTLEALLVREAAYVLAARVGKDATKLVAAKVQEIVDGTVRALVEPEVRRLFSEEGVQTTNTYGEPAGPKRSLREVIVEKGVKELTQSSDRYASRPQTVLDKMLSDEVQRAILKELRDAANEAKAQVRAAITEQGGKVLTETIERATRVL